ncbi:hypothetical protein QR680_002804 [Steinernema hermaphroditum]|uniref:Uncharacterized protein n=1 Tax=Steinernema hermaphroditum TaxID=289476 RepID=A0AA39LJ31_9BILA|nr:hypothetical protein QR680_002804 [Steinernema hermaphroditum]
MARTGANFRANLLERIGGQRSVVGSSTTSTASTPAVEAPKDLLEDSLSCSHEADLEKLRLYALKNTLPTDKRIFIWKLLLGVVSSIWAVKDELEKHRRAEAKMVLRSLVIMKKVPRRKLAELLCTYPDIVHMIRIADPSSPLQFTKKSSRPSDLALFSIVSRMYKLCTEADPSDGWIDAYWLSSKMNALLRKEFGSEELMAEAIRNVRELLMHVETEVYEEVEAASSTGGQDSSSLSSVLCSTSLPCGEVDRESPRPMDETIESDEVDSLLRKRSTDNSTDVTNDRRLTWPPNELNVKHDKDVENCERARKGSVDSVMMRARIFKEQCDVPASSYSADVLKSRAKLISKMGLLDRDRYSRSMEHLLRREAHLEDTESNSNKQQPTLDESRNEVELSEREFFEGSSDSTAARDKNMTSVDASSAGDSDSSLDRARRTMSDGSLATSSAAERSVKESKVKSFREVRRRHNSQRVQSTKNSKHIMIDFHVSSPDYPGASMEVHHPDVRSLLKPRTKLPLPLPVKGDCIELHTPDPAVPLNLPRDNEKPGLPGHGTRTQSEDTKSTDCTVENASVSHSLTVCKKSNEPDIPPLRCYSRSNSEETLSDLPSLTDHERFIPKDTESTGLPEPASCERPVEQLIRKPSEEEAEDGDEVETPIVEMVYGEIDNSDLTPQASANSSPTMRRDMSECTVPESPTIRRQLRRPKYENNPFDGLSDDHIKMWFLCGGSRYLSEESTLRLWDKICTGESITLLLTTLLVDLLEQAMEKWAAANENEEHKATSVFPVNRHISPEAELKIVAKSIESVYRDRKVPPLKSEEK